MRGALLGGEAAFFGGAFSDADPGVAFFAAGFLGAALFGAGFLGAGLGAAVAAAAFLAAGAF